MYRKIMVLILAVILCLTGCSSADKPEKTEDLEFTVVAEEEIPQELRTLIDSKKQSEFRLTYSDAEFLYLVAGYGEQATGGYSIQVKDMYLTKDSIYIDTELLGPKKGEDVSATPSYPFIVIKIPYREEQVIFD